MSTANQPVRKIPKNIQLGLKYLNPRAKVGLIAQDGTFGVALEGSGFQWIRPDPHYGWVDAGKSLDSKGAPSLALQVE